jgi:hypothetical protein
VEIALQRKKSADSVRADTVKKREELKRRLLEERKDPDWPLCEGYRWLKHTCSGGFHMNEVIFPRRVFQKLPRKLKEYFWDERNMSIVCGWFHTRYGHSTEFREYFKGVQEERYDLQEFIDNAPLKIRRFE